MRDIVHSMSSVSEEKRLAAHVAVAPLLLWLKSVSTGNQIAELDDFFFSCLRILSAMAMASSGRPGGSQYVAPALSNDCLTGDSCNFQCMALTIDASL